MKKEEIIEKGKYKVGDIHPNGKWIYTEYKPGVFDWRVLKKNQPSGVGDDSNNAKKTTPTSNQNVSATMVHNPMNLQQLTVWAQKTSDDNLLKVANNKSGNYQMRKIAYDALEQRGFDMTQVDISGNLSQSLKMTGKIGSAKTVNSDEEDEEDDVADAADGADIDIDDNSDGGDEDNEITEKWYLDSNDARVKKMFNLKTKQGRINYDQFVYKMKKKEKNYKNPVEVIQNLNEQYLEFLENDKQRFMISAGGSGIGKSYGFNKMAELLNMKPFEEGDTPGDGDYDLFEAPEVTSGKQLLSILKAHNGKIIVFDDNDNVLKRADCVSIMKKANAPTGKRIVGDPDNIKSNFEFIGRMIVMTNKNLDQLVESEDKKAILSRAMMVSEIYITIPETIEVMESRFQDYEFSEAPRLDDEEEDKKEREDIIDLIKKNQKNIDPLHFTTRVFQKLINSKRTVSRANNRRHQSAFAYHIGSKDKDWKETALEILTKAAVNDINISESSDDLIKAEEILFKGGQYSEDDGVDYTVDEFEDDSEVAKAERVLFGGEFKKSEFSEDILNFGEEEMNLQKAELILFGK